MSCVLFWFGGIWLFIAGSLVNCASINSSRHRKPSKWAAEQIGASRLCLRVEHDDPCSWRWDGLRQDLPKKRSPICGLEILASFHSIPQAQRKVRLENLTVHGTREAERGRRNVPSSNQPQAPYFLQALYLYTQNSRVRIFMLC
ncbi:hypothetical protein B0T10DRAFT_498460 [Thelonectria olida]|uniref:Secreted protein n=1 Tax=Thelonectria olida TaxID=1576542 RepID=A0A9P8VRX7_9HYPO|nr:hypothetical protein B0T10DRAFT_498460 [Thelonectria olida]